MMRNYKQEYEVFGISAPSLDKNYNPEDYGRELLKNTINNEVVIYSSATSYISGDRHCVKEQSIVTVSSQ